MNNKKKYTSIKEREKRVENIVKKESIKWPIRHQKMLNMIYHQGIIKAQ